MTTTSPINGLTAPDDDSPNDPPIHFASLIAQIDALLVGYFATVGDRDTAFSNWAAAGNSMRNGLVAAAGNGLYRYTTASPSGWREQFTDFQLHHQTFDSGQVATNSVLGTISIPAVPVPSRVVMLAMGKTGNPGSAAQDINWLFDTFPPATNVEQDNSAERVTAQIAQWVSITHTATMDLGAGQAGSPRLLVQATASVYNRGSIIWYRGPVTP